MFSRSEMIVKEQIWFIFKLAKGQVTDRLSTLPRLITKYRFFTHEISAILSFYILIRKMRKTEIQPVARSELPLTEYLRFCGLYLFLSRDFNSLNCPSCTNYRPGFIQQELFTNTLVNSLKTDMRIFMIYLFVFLRNNPTTVKQISTLQELQTKHYDNINSVYSLVCPYFATKVTTYRFLIRKIMVTVILMTL